MKDIFNNLEMRAAVKILHFPISLHDYLFLVAIY